MNIEALRIFCEVARQRSFTRAASTLRMTQPAASMAVQTLEKELDQQLIDRSHRPPQLTPAGERFYVGCREVLDRLDRTIAQMRALGKEVAGPVHVASIYSVGLYHTDEIRQFMEAYPKANVRLQYLRPNLVQDAVLQGDATLGLLSYPRESRELAVIDWLKEEMVLVCPPDHRLASRASVNPSDLDGENFIAFDSDLIIRGQVDAALHRHKVEVRVAMEFDNIETMKQAVQVGSGVSILPEATVRQEVRARSLATVRFEPSELVRPVGIIYRKDKPLSLAARRFIEILAGPSVLNGPSKDGDGEPAE
jgi:DNA-binding transcriptional LysR family regulator